MLHDPTIALSRFGLGPRADQPAPSDPRAWLRAQLQGADPLGLSGHDATNAGLAAVSAYQDMKKEQREENGGKGPNQTADKKLPNPLQQKFNSDTVAYCANALTTQTPFRERLVWFWVNHFTVSHVSLPIIGTLHPFIAEVIRPNVTGRFVDMVLAVMRHPAMLNYLNQEQSFGPNSRVGLRRGKGLNENLARECLELHTVSPASGYTQADVTSFARVLTGWSYEMKNEPLGFVFRPQTHEPGDKTVMGRTWPEGEEGGVMLLTWLADHPATHRHLAEKLVRHFVADVPPEADVKRIETVLRETNGDLGATSAALIDLAGAWQPLTKFRDPQDYVVASLRAVNLPVENAHMMPAALKILGQPLFKAPFPIGWPDRAADWAGPESLLQRVEFAYQLASRMPQIDPASLGSTILGPLLAADTLAAIHHAGSRRDALALLLSSPEFQRR